MHQGHSKEDSYQVGPPYKARIRRMRVNGLYEVYIGLLSGHPPGIP